MLLDSVGLNSAAFVLILALLARIEELNDKQINACHVAFKQLPTTDAFQALATAPEPIRNLSPNFVSSSLFAAHSLEGRYPMSLLMASAFDAKNKMILLAFALVPAESKEWWTRFLRFVSNAFPKGINNEE